MPLYSFECESCRHEFRVLASNGSPAVPSCPVCGAKNVRRLLPRVSIAYKGSGYYNTDYRGKKSSGAKPSSSQKNPPSDASSGSSSNTDDSS